MAEQTDVPAVHRLTSPGPGPTAASVPQGPRASANDAGWSMVGDEVEAPVTAALSAHRALRDLRDQRFAELMRLQGENASLRAALADERAKRQAVESDNTHIRDMITRQSAHHADLVAKYAALFSLHIKQPAVIPDAAPEFPVRALQHQRQSTGLLTVTPAGRVETVA